MIVRWNNSVHSDDVIDVPELIYHDEISIRTGFGNAPPDGNGVLLCRHPTWTADITWLRPDNSLVQDGGIGDFLQFRSFGSDRQAAMSQLARAVSNPQGSAVINGLWTCNAGGQPPLHVGLYARGNFIMIAIANEGLRTCIFHNG